MYMLSTKVIADDRYAHVNHKLIMLNNSRKVTLGPLLETNRITIGNSSINFSSSHLFKLAENS